MTPGNIRDTTENLKGTISNKNRRGGGEEQTLTNLIHLLFHFEKILEWGADNLDNTDRTETEKEYSCNFMAGIGKESVNV